MPFLQLLEIHQRRGDRASYEAVREDYHDNFDAFAPEWSTDMHLGRSLEEYPQAIACLQALWPTPLHAMRTLDGLLFRRNEADDAFDFPAYRELLFLYSIARELAGQVETGFGPIDLFLPLEDASAEASARDDAFCRWLTSEIGVAAIPLSAFYADGFDQKIARFCFAKKDETLDLALARLRAL